MDLVNHVYIELHHLIDCFYLADKYTVTQEHANLIKKVMKQFICSYCASHRYAYIYYFVNGLYSCRSCMNKKLKK